MTLFDVPEPARCEWCGEAGHASDDCEDRPAEVEQRRRPPPDLPAARRERDTNLVRVERAADDAWLEYAHEWAVAYLVAHREWFPDASWQLGLVEPREARAFGPVVLRLARAGVMTKTGEHRQRTRGHAATGPVWRSLIFDPEASWVPPRPPL